jgi:hypothetical protein
MQKKNIKKMKESCSTNRAIFPYDCFVGGKVVFDNMFHRGERRLLNK